MMQEIKCQQVKNRNFIIITKLNLTFRTMIAFNLDLTPFQIITKNKHQTKGHYKHFMNWLDSIRMTIITEPECDKTNKMSPAIGYLWNGKEWNGINHTVNSKFFKGSNKNIKLRFIPNKLCKIPIAYSDQPWYLISLSILSSTQSDQPNSLLLCTLWVVSDRRLLHEHSKDSDYTAWMSCLIWVFTGCSGHFVDLVMLWLNY